MNKDVKKIIDIVTTLEDWQYDNDKLYGNIRKIIKRSKKIWNLNHEELLNELEIVSDNEKIDYERLWYDLLCFPPEYPSYYDLNGMPMKFIHYSLPSDFNKLCFSDATIIDAILTSNLIIKLHGIFPQKNLESNGALLTFHKVTDVIQVNYDENENLKSNQDFNKSSIINSLIFSFCEIPAIRFLYKGFNLPYSEEMKKNRIFYINAGCILLVICNSWSIEEISGEDSK